MYWGTCYPNLRWYNVGSKSVPTLIQKDFSSGFCCDIILAGCHNGHLRESVDDHEKSSIAILSIRKALIPNAWMLWIVHAQNVYNHLVDDLCPAISLGMESCGLGELGVQHWPEFGQKFSEEPTIPIWDDRLWDPKVHPHSFKEEFSNGFCCDILLAGRHNGHLWEFVNDHKNTVDRKSVV